MIASRYARTFDYESLLAISIVTAVVGGLLVFKMSQPKPKLEALNTGWNDAVMNLEENYRESLEQPQSNPNPWGLPKLPALQIPTFSLNLEPYRLTRRELVWQVQGLPCSTDIPGNHWSGADGMYHCLVEKEVSN